MILLVEIPSDRKDRIWELKSERTKILYYSLGFNPIVS